MPCILNDALLVRDLNCNVTLHYSRQEQPYGDSPLSQSFCKYKLNNDNL